MISQIRVQRRVEFAETDMAGICHFSNLFRYMESAEAAFFEAAGHPLIGRAEGRLLGWPRVRAQASFHYPLRFRDRVEVHLVLAAIKVKALEFKCWLYKLEGEDRIVAASGGLTTVQAEMDPWTGQFASAALPASLLEKIGPAPEEECRRDPEARMP